MWAELPKGSIVFSLNGVNLRIDKVKKKYYIYLGLPCEFTAGIDLVFPIGTFRRLTL